MGENAQNLPIRYHNSLSDLTLKDFTPADLDLFFTLCQECQDRGTEEITLSFTEIKERASYKGKDTTQLIENLDNMVSRLQRLSLRTENETEITRFVLFPVFSINKKEKTLQLRVADQFAYILNFLTGDYTRMELEEFTKLKSAYSKECYRRLKRFRDTGWWQVSVDEFRDRLDIPRSYRVADIVKRVIAPIREELPSYFENFAVEEIRGTGRGRPIEAFRFTFTPQEVWTPVRQAVKKEKTECKCPDCGKALYLITPENGEAFYGHLDGGKEGAKCSKTYSYISEIKGVVETPTRDNNNAPKGQEPKTEKEKENVELLAQMLSRPVSKMGDKEIARIERKGADRKCPFCEEQLYKICFSDGTYINGHGGEDCEFAFPAFDENLIED